MFVCMLLQWSPNLYAFIVNIPGMHNVCLANIEFYRIVFSPEDEINATLTQNNSVVFLQKFFLVLTVKYCREEIETWVIFYLIALQTAVRCLFYIRKEPKGICLDKVLG